MWKVGRGKIMVAHGDQVVVVVDKGPWDTEAEGPIFQDMLRKASRKR